MTTATLPPNRTTFREAVAEVAAKAKAILPVDVNGRIESAVKLVLAQDVTPQDDGSILVGSSSDALRQYRLEGPSCECQDFTRGQAPEGWCQHRIAAGIQKRVQEVLAAQADPAPEPSTPPVEPEPASALGPLPEAAFSVTLKGLLDGQDALLTVRGASAPEFLRNLEAVRGLLDAPAPPPASVPQGKEWCAVHQVAMQENNKEGRTWYSHKTTEGWCKGRKGGGR